MSNKLKMYARVGTREGYLLGNRFGVYILGLLLRNKLVNRLENGLGNKLVNRFGNGLWNGLWNRLGNGLGSKHFFINYDNKQLIKKEYKDIIQCCTSFICTI